MAERRGRERGTNGKVVTRELIQRDLKSSPSSSDPLRTVPLEIRSLPAKGEKQKTGGNPSAKRNEERSTCLLSVPLLSTADVLVQIHSLPVGIVSRVERASVGVELVAEDQIVHLARIVDSPARFRRLWCVVIDQPKVSDDLRDLS